MKVKLTLGWLNARLDKTIEYYRLSMFYGSRVERSGIFNQKEIKTPIPDHFEYWKLMCTFHPWKHMFGSSMLAQSLPPETEIWLDTEAVCRILKANGESNV